MKMKAAPILAHLSLTMAFVRIVRDINKFSGGPLALSAGNFDGMHRGHRALLALPARQAARCGWETAVLSFEPHPLAVLGDFPVRRIGGVREKIKQVSGVNTLFLLRFTKSFSRQSGSEFASLIFDRLNVRYLAVGENFRFGRGREGNVSLLREEGKRRGAEVESAPLQTADGAPISSGRIRENLRLGDFSAAESLLGRPWTISGRVGRGRGLGQKIGFPTANLHLHFMPVCEGIFFAAARVGEKIIPAAVSIGKNPTVNSGGILKTEAHLIGFSGDLYGRRLTLRLLHKLRDEQKFSGEEELRAAIAGDVLESRRQWAEDKTAAAVFPAG